MGYRRDGKRGDPIRVVGAECPRHTGTRVVAHHVEAVDSERVGDAEHVAGELVHRELGDVVDPGSRRVAALGERDGVVAGVGERGELAGPARRSLRHAVQEDHGASVGGAGPPGLEREAIDGDLEPFDLRLAASCHDREEIVASRALDPRLARPCAAVRRPPLARST